MIPVSVVIPTYNAEAFVLAAIESIRSGSVQPAEIIVVDDGSTDRTRDVAAAAGVRVIAQPRNMGPSAARNAGVEAASSPWVAFLDADDVWYERKLELQWSALQRWPDAGFCFTDYDVMYANGDVLEGETGKDAAFAAIRRTTRAGSASRFEPASFIVGLVRSMFVRQSSVIVSRVLFQRCGGYDSRYRLGEDYDFFLRLAGHAPAIAIEEPLVLYRKRHDSLSADRIAEIASIDALWDAILDSPERYPEPAVALIRSRRIGTLHHGALLALRLGRFDEAVPFVRKALRLDSSLTTFALAGLYIALRSPVGQSLHTTVRRAWRSRAKRGRPRRTAAALPAE